MIVHFIRHAQSLANVDKVIAGQADSPLTSTGREQAIAIRPNIPVYDAVYSSPLQRANGTAQLALEKKERLWSMCGPEAFFMLLFTKDICIEHSQLRHAFIGFVIQVNM